MIVLMWQQLRTVKTGQTYLTSPASLCLSIISRLIDTSSSARTPIKVVRIRLSLVWSKLLHTAIRRSCRMVKTQPYPVSWSPCQASERHHRSTSFLPITLLKSPHEYHPAHRVNRSHPNFRGYWNFVMRCTRHWKWRSIRNSQKSSSAPVKILLFIFMHLSLPVLRNLQLRSPNTFMMSTSSWPPGQNYDDGSFLFGFDVCLMFITDRQRLQSS